MVRLSKEHGVNPSIDHCFVCGRELGIIMFGSSYRDENGKHTKAPMSICTGHLCDKCKEEIKKGYSFIVEVTNDSTEERVTKAGRYLKTRYNEGVLRNPVSLMRHKDFEEFIKEANVIHGNTEQTENIESDKKPC